MCYTPYRHSLLDEVSTADLVKELKKRGKIVSMSSAIKVDKILLKTHPEKEYTDFLKQEVMDSLSRHILPNSNYTLTLADAPDNFYKEFVASTWVLK